MGSSFKFAMEQAGLIFREPLIPDGKLHRFHVCGDKQGSKNGWYVLYDDSLPAGSFGSWKTGFKRMWSARAINLLTASEREEYRRRMDVARKAREAEEQARRDAAREKASAIWKASPPTPDDHPYLARKRVRNHGLRLHKGALVIPLHDSTGTIHSLQFIDGAGDKRFLSGGRKKGCYFAIGSPMKSLCITEGYATAASVHESTGRAVAVAFDAGNLESVARALRAKFPHIAITLCADNDPVGLCKAREAAASCGALLAVPPYPGDFNDLMTGVSR